ncbi:MAG: PAS domain S-box protein [Desulfobacterales bacterium]|nr:PAS domain S-box protein [Desulfobacterales bacterium]
MRVIVTWIFLALLAAGGILGSYALSEKFRANAREVWEEKASQSARWLSGTVLTWLEESYAPLSGLAILFENSSEVSEVEYLGATDALEARATAFFLDANAVARPKTDGEGWSIEFSNDPLGPLSPSTPLDKSPVILDTIRLAVANPDQIMLGPPFSGEEGSRLSPVVLGIQDVRGPLAVIGLVNYDAIARGLFDIHTLDGLQLQIQGRFQEPGGPGPLREVIGKPQPEALHAVTTRTVSAGADLSITWYAHRRFSQGPQEALANLTFMGGFVGTLIITAFIAFFIQRDQTITRRVHEATAELKKVSEAIEHSPVSVVITAKDGTIEYVNPTFSEVTGYSADEAIGQNPSVLKSGDLPRSFYKELWDTIISGNVWQGEFKNRKKSGEEFWESASISPILNNEGEITHFVAVKEDITERKRIEDQQKERAARTRAIVDHAADGIITINEQRIIEEFNPAAERIFGYKAAEVIGQNINILVPEPHHSRHDSYVQNYLETGQAKIIGVAREMPARRKDGTTFPIYLAVSDVQLKDRRIFTGIVRDISELKQAEEALRERALQLRTIFQKSPMGILHVDKDGIVLNCNERHAELMGSTPEKIIGMNLREEIKNDDVRTAVFGALAGEQNEFEGEYTSVSGGKTIVVRSVFSPIEPGTSPTEVINTTEDITERKKMEHELQRRIQELDEAQSAMLNMMEDLDEEKSKAEEATRAKSDFLANMSHEIRTPMNAVIGMAHLALKTELTSKQRDYLNKIQTSANSLLGIINDILDFSKIEAGKLDMETVEFDLLETMDNVANVITVKAQEREDLEVLFYLDPEVPNFLVGDSLRLNQILVNLGNNAVKFTEQGEIVLSVRVNERSDDQVTLQFSVRDTGIGMTAEQQSKLFQAFSQADTSTTRKYGGTGLGLTISKRLVNLMGGEIWTESESGQGTTFHFTADFGLGKEMVKKRFEPSPDLRGLKVLVVDDNATSREILQDILESFSFEVFSAPSGKEALEEIEKADNDKPFELIIMDWKMPGMDGIEASRRIKSHRNLTTIPAIVLVTAYGREEVMRQAEEIGLDGFLLKPVNSSVMFDAIMQGLGKEVRDVARAGREKEPGDAALNTISGARVLLVEDNEINQQVAQEILQGAGLIVEVANNGQEGVDAARQNEYDIILMDIQMPVMDGHTAAREIRKWEKEKEKSEVGMRKSEKGENSNLKSEIQNLKSDIESVPIIAMTAHAMAGDEQKSLDAGMNGHVTKPIDPDQLFAALKQWIKPAAERVAVAAEPMPDQPPAAEQAVSGEDDLPETLPGFDLAAGLSRLMGNRRLYRKLLVDFGTKYTNAADDIGKALDDGDFDQAHGLIHNLKGLSGNLDATALQKATVGLEQLVKGQAPGDVSDADVNQKYAELKDALDQALNSVQSLGIAAKAAPSDATAQESAAIPAELESEVTEQLKAAAEMGDVMQVASIAKDLKADNQSIAPFCDKLIQLAEDFDFDGIQGLLEKV